MSQEIEFMQKILTETNNKLLVQSDLVVNLRKQISNFERIIKEKDSQVDLSQELSQKLQADLKKQKIKNKLTMGGGILAVIGALVLAK